MALDRGCCTMRESRFSQAADDVVPAVARHIHSLPDELRRSLTWDRGTEMAKHGQFTVDTGVQVYFCDPRSPWQRDSNENSNGLLRQYFPKCTTLAGIPKTTSTSSPRDSMVGRARPWIG